MASIEYIEKRITGKEKEIAKLEKKLARIQKAQASNWEDNPYYYDESVLRYTAKDLDRARKALEDYKAQLITETEKKNSRNVKAIIDYLEAWKARVSEFYHERFAEYPEALRQYEADMKEFKLSYWDERELKKNDPEAYAEYKSAKELIEGTFYDRYGFLTPYLSRALNPETRRYDLWVMDEDKLAKDLKNEADRKYDNIIERTNEITGEITDATALKIGHSGELDGYVTGERGTAHVHTIGAGGYNIQRFHFRVLVHRVK